MKKKNFTLTFYFALAALVACTPGDRQPPATALQAFHKGKAAYLKRDLATAETWFTRALVADGSLVNARVMLGKTCYFLRQQDAAKQALRTALTQQPGHVEAHYYLARLALLEGKHAQAIGHLQAILNIDPHNARANYALGSLYAAGRDWKRAFRHFNQALEEESMLARVRCGYARHLQRAGLRERAKHTLTPALSYPVAGKLRSEIRSLWEALQ